jgi:hypothetical protein
MMGEIVHKVFGRPNREMGALERRTLSGEDVRKWNQFTQDPAMSGNITYTKLAISSSFKNRCLLRGNDANTW